MIGILRFRFFVLFVAICVTGCAAQGRHGGDIIPGPIDGLLLAPDAKALKKLDWDVIQSPAGFVTVRNIRNKQGKIVRTEKVSDAELLALRQRQAELTTPTPGNR